MHAAIALLTVASLSFAAPAKPCRTGLYQDPSGLCRTSCPSGFFGDGTTGKCLPCFSSNFRTCNSARSTAALSCIPGYSLKSGRCGKICPVPHSVVSTDCYAEQCEAGWIADGGNCYKHCQAGYHAASVADDALCVRCSDANAATCGAGGGTLTCKEQYYPDDTTKKCVPFSTCPAGSYVWQLDDSPSGCQNCTGEGVTACENLTGRAQSCTTGYKLFVEAGLCVKTCPTSRTTIGCISRAAQGDLTCLPTYPSGDTCLPCGGNGSTSAGSSDAHSSTCSATGQPLTCLAGYRVVNNKCTANPGVQLQD